MNDFFWYFTFSLWLLSVVSLFKLIEVWNKYFQNIIILSAVLLGWKNKLSDNHIIKQVTQARRAAGFLGAFFVLFKTLPNGHFTIGHKNITATKVFRQYSRQKSRNHSFKSSSLLKLTVFFIHQFIQNLEETHFLSELWVISILRVAQLAVKFWNFLLFFWYWFKTFNFKWQSHAKDSFSNQPVIL